MVSPEGESRFSTDTARKQSALFAMAIKRALMVHWNQVDKAGAPYLLHPIRMMFRMETLEEKMVALLHDVVEDSSKENPVTLEDLRNEGFPGMVVDAVDCLTKRREGNNGEEHYRSYLAKIKSNNLARKVKLADLEDNMDLGRLKVVTARDMKRLNKYKSAFEYLSN